MKLSPTKTAPKSTLENNKKNVAIKERRISEKDRYKTRTLSKGEFEGIAKGQDSGRPPKSPQNHHDDSANTSDAEGLEHKAKIVKPVVRAKSGIPIVRSKLPTSKSPYSCT